MALENVVLQTTGQRRLLDLVPHAFLLVLLCESLMTQLIEGVQQLYQRVARKRLLSEVRPKCCLEARPETGHDWTPGWPGNHPILEPSVCMKFSILSR